MIRKSILALLLAAIGVSAHAALNMGDIAFPLFNAYQDGLSLVTFSKFAVPDLTAFTVTAVPEPKNNSMLLAGLGLMGFIAIRRGR